MDQTILVFSATGQQGTAVTRELIRSKFKVRGYTRDETSNNSNTLKEMGVRLFQGSLDSEADLLRAMKGVDGIFLVLPPCWSPTSETDEAEWHTGKLIIDVAKQSNVKSIVYSSVMGSELQEPFRPLFKYTIEKYLQASGINYTIFKPAAFFENFYMPQYGLAEKSIYNPLPASMLLPFISVEDIGTFTRLAFEDPGSYEGKVMNIAGELITADQLALIFSELLSVQISTVQLPPSVITSQNELLGKFMEALHQVGYPEIDIDDLKKLNPELMNTRQWVEKYGIERLSALVSPPILD